MGVSASRAAMKRAAQVYSGLLEDQLPEVECLWEFRFHQP
jgi:hypothetical protein